MCLTLCPFSALTFPAGKGLCRLAAPCLGVWGVRARAVRCPRARLPCRHLFSGSNSRVGREGGRRAHPGPEARPASLGGGTLLLRGLRLAVCRPWWPSVLSAPLARLGSALLAACVLLQALLPSFRWCAWRPARRLLFGRLLLRPSLMWLVQLLAVVGWRSVGSRHCISVALSVEVRSLPCGDFCIVGPCLCFLVGAGLEHGFDCSMAWHWHSCCCLQCRLFVLASV